MRKTIFLLWSFVIVMTTSAIEMPNGEPTQNNVSLGQVKSPMPRFADVTDPIAMYNTVTDVLTFTLDATYYGEYTITIESTLTTVDYYPTSATTVIPLTGADNNVSIYIESDECGCWYGELDKAEFSGQMDN